MLFHKPLYFHRFVAIMGRCSFSNVIQIAFLLAGATERCGHCTGQLEAINHGCCNNENNIIAAYSLEGGDCCAYSCTTDRLYPYGIWGYNCSDPDVFGDADGSKNEPASVGICLNDYNETLVVNDTTSAASLAEAISCFTGQMFDVVWRGSVSIDRTIFISDGTTVNVTGEGLKAEVNGNWRMRLFMVEDATLHIDGLVLSNGNATNGGAIAAMRSNVSLNQTVFRGNMASGFGGAIYIGKSSTLAWKTTKFAGNHSGRGGGAVTVSVSSTCAWSGPTDFFNNTAGDGGGAVYVNNQSTVFGNGVANFNNNAAYSTGGAMFVEMNSTASWDGMVSFVGNTADSGGALFVGTYSGVSWNGETF